MPVGLQAVQKRDVVLRCAAESAPGIALARGVVEMIQPEEDRPLELLCQEGANRGVDGEHPNALALFTSSIAFCMLSQLHRYEQARKLHVEDARVTVTARWHIEGSIIAGTIQSRPLAFDLDIALVSPEPRERLAEMLRVAEQTCYVTQSLNAELVRTVTVNGEPFDG